MFKKQPDIKLPKGMTAPVLAYDIETSYMITQDKRWGYWDERPIERTILQDFQILTIGWHWLGDTDKQGRPKVYVVGQDDFPNYKRGVNDDTEIVKFGRELLHNAAAVLGHNSDSFDNKKLHARIVIRNINPPSPYKKLDTKKMAKRVGGFSSNQLKHLAMQLNVPYKLDAGGIATWDGFIAGDRKSIKHMKTYNKGDIPPLVGIYERLAPHDTQVLPYNTMTDNPESCPNPLCGSTRLQSRGFNFTKVGKYRRFVCIDCGRWLQSRTPEKTVRPSYV